MIGTKFNNPLPAEDEAAYSEAAAWANENGAMIVDQGNHYEVVQAPPMPQELILATAIAKRDSMLAATDWYAIRASEPDGKPIPDAVLEYRKALREIDKQLGWPGNVNWPVLSA